MGGVSVSRTIGVAVLSVRAISAGKYSETVGDDKSDERVEWIEREKIAGVRFELTTFGL